MQYASFLEPHKRGVTSSRAKNLGKKTRDFWSSWNNFGPRGPTCPEFFFPRCFALEDVTPRSAILEEIFRGLEAFPRG
jgi:hypothetical protein